LKIAISNNISVKLIDTTINIILYIKNPLTCDYFMLSDKSVRVYVVFICRESSFHYIAMSYYLACSNLSIFSIFRIEISFNLEYKIDLFK
jgi:hypothetical protein